MKFLRRPFAALAMSAALCATFSTPARAVLPVAAGPANVTWTGGGVPYPGVVWDNGQVGQWSNGVAPTGVDTAIFPTTFIPSRFDAQAGVRTDGSEILLANAGTGAPTAANLVFLNNWTLTQKPGTTVYGDFPIFFTFPPSGLTLTQGGVTVAPGVTATINATINLTGGPLNKMGLGTLLLEQTVNGSILVQQGVLGGNFTVNGNLTNLATLSPGNSPGKIVVNGNFQQAKGASLKIEVASPTSFDQLIVSGNAKLGGKVDASLLNGFQPARGEKFTILTAGGGVSGRFDAVNAPVWDLLTLRPFYGPDSVTLEAVINSFEALPGLTPNQQAVARSLDAVIYDSRETKLVNYLYNRSFNELPGAFDRIAPEELTSIFTMGVALEQVQAGNIQRRTDDIRAGSSGFSAAGLAINGSGPGYSGSFRTGVAGPTGNELRDGGKEVKETKEIVPAENRWGAFLAGTGEWINVGDTDNARGYDLASGGFTLGVDYKVTPNLAIGLAAGYTGTTADLTQGGRIYVNGGKIGLYGTFFQNEQPAPTMSKDSSKDSSKEAPASAPSIAKGFYADVAVFGGYNSYDTHRSALQGAARGDTDGGELNALFGAGYDFKSGGLTFGPTASFNYTYVGTNGFTESGSLAPLNIHGGDAESLRTAFGFKASYDIRAGGVVIKPELRAAWQHEYGETAYALDSNFANGGGGTFTVNGPQLGRDSLLVGAGFAVLFNERTSAFVYYDGELARTNYQSTSVTGGIRLAF